MAKRLAVALVLLLVVLASCDGRELKGKGGAGGAVDEVKDLLPGLPVPLPPLVPDLPLPPVVPGIPPAAHGSADNPKSP
ncbi:uncharacterized protein LOC119356481 [Triticum dicoccoides]|uniref:uncharacterized protein LOC119356481 n=1 Tax=Triticum dicoccoides TaxID=85692 RepID=UPI00188DF19B|nr:uncharacterized protein LOC119356481 [Triticum dicoccoides]